MVRTPGNHAGGDLTMPEMLSISADHSERRLAGKESAKRKVTNRPRPDCAAAFSWENLVCKL